MQPALVRQERRQPRHRRVHHVLDPPLGDVGQLGDRDLGVVHHQRDRLAVEVAGGDHRVVVGKDQRIVGDRVDLARQHFGRVAQRVARRAVHLRHAAQRVGVLDLVAVGVRRVDRRVGRDLPARWRRSPRRPDAAAHRRDARVERRPRSLERLERHRRRRCRRRSRVRAHRDTASAPIAVIACVPLISASPSFASSVTGARPTSASAPAAGSTASPNSTLPSPISASAMCASGARSPLAPTDPCDGITG